MIEDRWSKIEDVGAWFLCDYGTVAAGCTRMHPVEATPDGPEVLPEVPMVPEVPAMPAEAGDVLVCLFICLFFYLFNYNNYI